MRTAGITVKVDIIHGLDARGSLAADADERLGPELAPPGFVSVPVRRTTPDRVCGASDRAQGRRTVGGGGVPALVGGSERCVANLTESQPPKSGLMSRESNRVQTGAGVGGVRSHRSRCRSVRAPRPCCLDGIRVSIQILLLQAHRRAAAPPRHARHTCSGDCRSAELDP